MTRRFSDQDPRVHIERLPSAHSNERSEHRDGAYRAQGWAPNVERDSTLDEYYPVDYFGDPHQRGEALEDNSWTGGGIPRPLSGNRETGYSANASDDRQPQQANYRGRGPKGYERSDERIREDICERLTEDPAIDASGVTVDCRSGKVVLEGTVPERPMKHRIEDTVDACCGVKDIDNRLTVEKSPDHTGSNAQARDRDEGSSQGKGGCC